MKAENIQKNIADDGLREFFNQNNKAALGFSGGVDSSYILYAALQNNADIMPYFVKSPFQPQFELDDAKRLVEFLNCNIKIIDIDIDNLNSNDADIVSNGEHRCYYCKKKIFTTIKNQAIADGYKVLIDGSNASDDAADRQGMRATAELEVRSPLRECGINKTEIRRLSKEAGLFTWNKPAYACLATRIKTSVPITAELLRKIEKSEDFLFTLGYTDFRVRTDGESAKIQVTENQAGNVIADREKIYLELHKYFADVTLDLKYRD